MAFLDKLNKMAKNIEDKTGDALEISKYTAQKAKEEMAYREDLREIGKFYYDFYIAGGQVEPEIMAVMQSAKAHADAVAEAQKLIDGIRDENALERAEKEAAKKAAAEQPPEKVAEEIPVQAQEPVAVPVEEIAVNAENVCSACGSKMADGARFCGECGNKVEG